MKVLFIGGTGVISSASAELAVARGIDLTLLNRGRTSQRPVPEGAKVLIGDIRQPASVRELLSGLTFDVVVNWLVYTPDQAEVDLELFRGRTAQYVFISSASAYHRPVLSLPITESTPLHNPYWAYSRDKIACEERLMRAYRDEGFPVTIVRRRTRTIGRCCRSGGAIRSSTVCAGANRSSCTVMGRRSGCSRTIATLPGALSGCWVTHGPPARRTTSHPTRFSRGTRSTG